MKILVFDTETTGFIDKKIPDLNAQPSIVQFAGIFGELQENGTFQETKRINQLVKPPRSIPAGASRVHHIYDIDVKDKPPIAEKMNSFLELINDADIVIGHNIEYDEDMMKLELKRLWKEYEYRPKQTFCTMKTTVEFCGLLWSGERLKYPKLGELYKKLFGEYFLGAHDAIVDVEATLKIFLELYQKKIITIQTPPSQILSLF